MKRTPRLIVTAIRLAGIAAFAVASITHAQPAPKPLPASAAYVPNAAEVAKATREEEKEIQFLPRTDFFKTSSSEVQGAPGTLIRSEKSGDYDIPKETRATRFLYRSRTQFDQASVASAVLVVPNRKAPEGGWPLLVWAQGTPGVASKCAPSLSRPVGYYTKTLVEQGLALNFAVLSVAYSGLGAGTRAEYLWKVSNANDVAFAAPAARALDPQLAPIWVAIGHSQGGQAVWGVAEKMTSLKDATYRGSVALAPAVDSKPLIENVGSTEGETFYPVYVAFGIKSVYPAFDIRSMLLPTGIEAYPLLTENGCWGFANRLFKPVEPGSVVRPDWDRSKEVQQFIASNQVGEKPISGALFVASGLSDTAVPPRIISTRVKAMCSSNAEVMYRAYPGDHGTMMESSFKDQMQWITDRFRGVPAPKQCP